MARRYKSIIYAIHGVQFPDSATPQTLTYQGYATPVGQVFNNYATPIGQVFNNYATPLGQVFQSYATPLYGIVPPGGTAGQILTKADSSNYSVYWQTTTPFQGYATPIGGTVGGSTFTGFATPMGANYSAFHYTASTPLSADMGDLWVSSDSGIFYIYINDGDTSQWVQFGGGGGSSRDYATPVGQIQTNQIADSAVTTAKIASGAVQPVDMATPFTGFATPTPGTASTKVFALFIG